MLFLIYEKRSFVKLCDLGPSTEQSFYYIIEDKKREQKSIEAAGCGMARIHIESAHSSICLQARLSFTSLITQGAGRWQDLATGALQWHMLTSFSLLPAKKGERKQIKAEKKPRLF